MDHQQAIQRCLKKIEHPLDWSAAAIHIGEGLEQDNINTLNFSLAEIRIEFISVDGYLKNLRQALNHHETDVVPGLGITPSGISEPGYQAGDFFIHHDRIEPVPSVGERIYSSSVSPPAASLPSVSASSPSSSSSAPGSSSFSMAGLTTVSMVKLVS